MLSNGQIDQRSALKLLPLREEGHDLRANYPCNAVDVRV
jgi:hypothetical protein